MRLKLGMLVLLACGSASAEETPNWAQYGGPKRDFSIPAPASVGKGEDRLWRRDLGPGTSGIVCDGTSLFTMYSIPDSKNVSAGQEVVVALDPKTGKSLWEVPYPVARLKGQESFSGEPIRPLSTPALLGARLCTLGYTGLLKCFDPSTGKVIWEYDLVKEFEATPVQFGFASSPLVTDGRFVVHVGGKQTILVAFDPKDGKVVWKSKGGEPSYASPVVMPTKDGDTIVQVTRDAIFGLSAKDGQERWKFPMPKPLFTNVPTPIVLPKQRLLVSGQGLKGTRLLEVAEAGDRVTEVWKNEKSTFFATNWLADDAAVYGIADKFFVALSLTDGKELWRDRTQSDANAIRVGPDALVLRGDGRLSRCKLSRTGLEPNGNIELLSGRCWMAPTVQGEMLYARSEKEITAIRLSAILKP